MPDETPRTAPTPGILRKKSPLAEMRERAAHLALNPPQEDPFPPAETLRTVGDADGLTPEQLEEMRLMGASPAPSIAPSPLGPPTAEEDAMLRPKKRSKK